MPVFDPSVTIGCGMGASAISTTSCQFAHQMSHASIGWNMYSLFHCSLDALREFGSEHEGEIDLSHVAIPFLGCSRRSGYTQEPAHVVAMLL